MSQDNVEVVRRFIEAARSGDDAIEAFIAVSDPSLEHTRLPAASGPDTYFGHDGLRRWLTDMGDLWREWRSEVEELVAVGPDTVAARMRFIAVGKDSGVPVEARLGLVCVLSEGKVLRSRTYASGKEALQAVNVDVLRRLLRAFNERDVQAIVAECDPAVVWEEQFIPGADPVYRGHAGMRRWAALVVDQEELASLAGRLERIEEADDMVMTSICFEGEGTSSGVEVDMRVHLVFTLRNGKVVRRQVFRTLAEALSAVGLAE